MFNVLRSYLEQYLLASYYGKSQMQKQKQYNKPWVLFFKNYYVCGQMYFIWTCLFHPSTHSALQSVSSKQAQLSYYTMNFKGGL